MATTGRPATPNHLKVVAGVDEARLNRNEPVPAAVDDLKSPPAGLPEAAQVVWRRLAPDLVDKKVLTAWDSDLFGAYCIAKAQYDACRERMGDDYVVMGSMKQLVKSPYWVEMNEALTQMIRLSARFGLSPADRAGLVVNAGNEAPKAGGERLIG